MLAVVVSSLAGSAQGASWHLGEATLIDADGTRPRLWEGTIAYSLGTAVWYYDGAQSILVADPPVSNWDPVNANGSVAWRNSPYGSPDHEIFRWDGADVVNISNSPGVDSDVTAGGNGDLIWRDQDKILVYYDASDGSTTTLGVQGTQPSLYITDSGLATYAYQDSDTESPTYRHVIYVGNNGFPISLGPGAEYGAVPSLWNGAVAWIAEGEVGSTFTNAEVYYWKDGATQRLTEDDPAIADEFPSVWNDRVIWGRCLDGAFSPPAMFIWDGTEVTQLTASSGTRPSFHTGQVAWTEDTEGVLFLADVLGELDGDCDEDGDVDHIDYADFESCLTGPDVVVDPGCTCFDLDDDGHVDLEDFAVFQRAFTGSP